MKLLGVTGLNHITLAVKEVTPSVNFYVGVLGFTLRKQWRGGAHLEAGTLWLCLSRDAATRSAPHPDYTHLALDISAENFDGLADKIRQSGTEIWKDNKSEGASFYFLDPDGHKLELHSGSLATRLTDMKAKGR